jgi:hypothetical protein
MNTLNNLNFSDLIPAYNSFLKSIASDFLDTDKKAGAFFSNLKNNFSSVNNSARLFNGSIKDLSSGLEKLKSTAGSSLAPFEKFEDFNLSLGKFNNTILQTEGSSRNFFDYINTSLDTAVSGWNALNQSMAEVYAGLSSADKIPSGSIKSSGTFPGNLTLLSNSVNSSGVSGGVNGTGDPTVVGGPGSGGPIIGDLRQNDPILKNLTQLYLRLTEIINDTRSKGVVNTGVGIMSFEATPLIGAIPPVWGAFVDKYIKEQIYRVIPQKEKIEGSRIPDTWPDLSNRVHISKELIDSGIDPKIVNNVDWDKFIGSNWLETAFGMVLGYMGKFSPKIENFSKGWDVNSTVSDVLFGDFKNSTKLDIVREKVAEALKERRKSVEAEINSRTPNVEMGEPYQSQSFPEYFYENRYLYLPNNLPITKENYEKIMMETFDKIMEDWGSDDHKEKNRKFLEQWFKSQLKTLSFNKTVEHGMTGGVKDSGDENNSFNTLNTKNSTSLFKTKGNQKDPYEVFKAAGAEAQKLGGALSNIMGTLNIGSRTFVGQVVSGFNTVFSVISSIMQVIQSAQAVGGFFDFLGGILKVGSIAATVATGGAAAPLAISVAGGLSGGGFAAGGSIPGIGDTDSVPAMLTPGEFVIRKSVVNKLGTGFFEWINGGGLMNSLAGHYAGGGTVNNAPSNIVQTIIPEVVLRGKDLVILFNRANDNINLKKG